MTPIPGDEEMVRVEQAADLDGDFRDAPGEERAGEAANNGSSGGDHRALPEEDGGDIAGAVPHRAQDRDLLQLREDRHGQDVKDAEPSQQDDQRDGDSGG